MEVYTTKPTSPHGLPPSSSKLGYALTFARRGNSILMLHSVTDAGRCTCGNPACEHAGKHPIGALCPRGAHSATTDLRLIRTWFKRAPWANYGVVPENIVIIDSDSSEAEAKIRHLGGMETATVVTHRGHHRYYESPQGPKLRTCKPFPDCEIRAGRGSYVVGPGSVHSSGQVYAFEEKHVSLSPLPEWAIEAATGLETPPAVKSTEESAATLSLNGEPIPEGSRNDTLTSFAGQLHDGRPFKDLLTALQAINEERCSPPLHEQEVRKIAQSISSRPPCKHSAQATQETLEALSEIEENLLTRRWKGVGGKSERDIIVALIKLARRHGKLIPSGVRVQVSIRKLALQAAMAKSSAEGALKRLKQNEVVRSDNAERNSTAAGALVLLAPTSCAKSGHSPMGGASARGSVSVPTSRAPLSAPRLRWSAPRFDRIGDEVIRTTIKRLGKTAGAVIDTLEAAGGYLTLEELAQALYVTRPRDLRRRDGPLERLEKAEVVECVGDIVRLVDGWLEALDWERAGAGEIAACRRDKARYQREREAFQDRHRHKSDPAPSQCEMDSRRRERELRNANGVTGELTKLPPQLSIDQLYALMNKPVSTQRGRGRLWQAFSSGVGVVLDEAPTVVTFMDPAEVVGVA